jgi:hypothetical protein
VSVEAVEAVLVAGKLQYEAVGKNVSDRLPELPAGAARQKPHPVVGIYERAFAADAEIETEGEPALPSCCLDSGLEFLKGGQVTPALRRRGRTWGGRGNKGYVCPVTGGGITGMFKGRAFQGFRLSGASTRCRNFAGGQMLFSVFWKKRDFI